MRHYRVVFQDVVLAHNEAILYGGLDGLSSTALVESAIARPYSGYYRPIHKKSAALLHSLVKNHGFVDGNKRTALLTTLLLLTRSGFRLELQEYERLDDIVVLVASDGMNFHELATWFRSRIRKA